MGYYAADVGSSKVEFGTGRRNRTDTSEETGFWIQRVYQFRQPGKFKLWIIAIWNSLWKSYFITDLVVAGASAL